MYEKRRNKKNNFAKDTNNNLFSALLWNISRCFRGEIEF